KSWGDPEWDQYFRIFGTPAEKAFQQFNTGNAQRMELSGVPRPQWSPEDARFYAGMAVFAGITTLVEAGYPIVMTEILSAIFIEPIVGAATVVAVESTSSLVICHGGRIIKLAGKRLDDVTEFLIRSRNVKNGAKIEDVAEGLTKFVNE